MKRTPEDIQLAVNQSLKESALYAKLSPIGQQFFRDGLEVLLGRGVTEFNGKLNRIPSRQVINFLNERTQAETTLQDIKSGLLHLEGTLPPRWCTTIERVIDHTLSFLISPKLRTSSPELNFVLNPDRSSIRTTRTQRHYAFPE